MHRSRTVPRSSQLADGRAIHYFDDEPGRYGPPPPDRRTLEATASHAELRQDALFDEWVVIATHRQTRTHLPAASDCPLCASTEAAWTEVPAADYDVVVFDNRFPSLPASLGDEPPRGHCDVIVFSSDHSASFARLDSRRLRTIGDAWAQRSETLAAEDGVRYVLAFENRGEQIGVTLHHPHGQIYAYPYLPPRIERLVVASAAHRERTGSCLGCDLLDGELADGSRIVGERPQAVAYVPAAARWPFEIHVVPRRHVTALERLMPDELDELVQLQADVLHRLDGLFDHPTPYMAGWLPAPVGAGEDGMHLRLQIVSPQRAASKLKFLAGSETLAGAFINDVRPEDAAQRLRDAAGRPPDRRAD